MVEHSAEFHQTLSRLRKERMGTNYPSGEVDASFTDRAQKRSKTSMEIGEKTKVGLAVGTMAGILGATLWVGIAIGQLQSDRVAIQKDIAELYRRAEVADKNQAEVHDALLKLTGDSGRMSDDLKTLLRHSDALLWSHGKPGATKGAEEE